MIRIDRVNAFIMSATLLYSGCTPEQPKVLPTGCDPVPAGTRVVFVAINHNKVIEAKGTAYATENSLCYSDEEVEYEGKIHSVLIPSVSYPYHSSEQWRWLDISDR